MLLNILKTSFRNLWRNKTNAFLNLFGLALGIACAGLIFLWVESELNFDKGNTKKENLYFVKINQKYDTYTATFGSTPGLMGPALIADIPGIANACRVTEDQTSLLFSFDNKTIYASGKYAEASIFSMFTMPFIEGNANTAFTQLHSIVLTEKTAKKFFGQPKNVIGKTVRIDNKQDYIVSAVLKDIPENSSLQFEWLAPFEIYYQQSPWARKWDNQCLSTYVELKESADPNNINKQLFNYIDVKLNSKSNTTHPFLWAMKNWRLYDQFDNGKPTGSGRIAYVHFFSLIAWIILLIACINFMNLATAQSEKRAKEVGIRKVMGADKSKLMWQFICEALVMALLAVLIAVILISLALPFFNSLVQKDLSNNLYTLTHFLALIIIALICGLLAGSYPAFYLSSFNPVFVLKGIKSKQGVAAYVRKGLVVMQFTISIILIIGTIIIYQQIQHVKGRNLGFNKDNLMQLKLQGDMLKNRSVIKQDLLNTGLVENMAVTDHETIYGGNNTSSVNWPGKDPNSNILISQRLVSPEFISTAGLQIISGRDFQPTDIMEMTDDFKQKDSTQTFNIIITESMEKLLGHGSGLGKPLQIPGQKQNQYYHLKVTGIIKDYVYGDMYGKSDPVIFYCLPQFTSLMYIRIKSGKDVEQALQGIARVLKKYNPAYPFEYKFVDSQFNEMFLSETLISKISRLFAGLAILISCLGLFGLAAYTAERRTKEIGVRKVLGASAAGLAALLSRDFLKLVLVSCIIAFPIAWLLMQHWLQSYNYRIEISWWIFLIAGLLANLIALITVSYQAIKAAIANPVKSLRTE